MPIVPASHNTSNSMDRAFGIALERLLRLIFLVCLGVSTAANSANNYYETTAASQGDITKKIERLKEQAASGSAKAQYAYGVYLLSGEFVPKDAIAGLRFLKQSADAGYTKANVLIGTIFQQGGDGYLRDLSLAEYYLTRAAAKDDPQAMYRLWILYSSDQKDSDPAKGGKMLEAAAKRNYPSAMADLGRFLVLGERGYAIDFKRGIALLNSSSLAGDSRAMSMLAYLYAGGGGSRLDKNYRVALAWAKLSQSFATRLEFAAQGAAIQKELEAHMSSEDKTASDSLFDKLEVKIRLRLTADVK